MFTACVYRIRKYMVWKVFKQVGRRRRVLIVVNLDTSRQRTMTDDTTTIEQIYENIFCYHSTGAISASWYDNFTHKSDTNQPIEKVLSEYCKYAKPRSIPKYYKSLVLQANCYAISRHTTIYSKLEKNTTKNYSIKVIRAKFIKSNSSITHTEILDSDSFQLFQTDFLIWLHFMRLPLIIVAGIENPRQYHNAEYARNKLTNGYLYKKWKVIES